MDGTIIPLCSCWDAIEDGELYDFTYRYATEIVSGVEGKRLVKNSSTVIIIRMDFIWLTSSPSLLSLGALTYARLRVLSWAGLLTLAKIRVSPDSTLLTFA